MCLNQMNVSVEDFIVKALLVITVQKLWAPLTCNAACVASTVDGHGTYFTEFVLQTILFLIIIVFHVSITTASLNALCSMVKFLPQPLQVVQSYRY